LASEFERFKETARIHRFEQQERVKELRQKLAGDLKDEDEREEELKEKERAERWAGVIAAIAAGTRRVVWKMDGHVVRKRDRERDAAEKKARAAKAKADKEEKERIKREKRKNKGLTDEQRHAQDVARAAHQRHARLKKKGIHTTTPPSIVPLATPATTDGDSKTNGILLPPRSPAHATRASSRRLTSFKPTDSSVSLSSTPSVNSQGGINSVFDGVTAMVADDSKRSAGMDGSDIPASTPIYVGDLGDMLGGTGLHNQLSGPNTNINGLISLTTPTTPSTSQQSTDMARTWSSGSVDSTRAPTPPPSAAVSVDADNSDEDLSLSDNTEEEEDEETTDEEEEEEEEEDDSDENDNDDDTIDDGSTRSVNGGSSKAAAAAAAKKQRRKSRRKAAARANQRRREEEKTTLSSTPSKRQDDATTAATSSTNVLNDDDEEDAEYSGEGDVSEYDEEGKRIVRTHSSDEDDDDDDGEGVYLATSVPSYFVLFTSSLLHIWPSLGW
jgi:hypothetical protein